MARRLRRMHLQRRRRRLRLLDGCLRQRRRRRRRWRLGRRLHAGMRERRRRLGRSRTVRAGSDLAHDRSQRDAASHSTRICIIGRDLNKSADAAADGNGYGAVAVRKRELFLCSPGNAHRAGAWFPSGAVRNVSLLL